MAVTRNTSIHLPNILLIAGNGRNVGKTTLACQIISFFAAKTEVTGLKISPHFHSFNHDDVRFKNENLIIIEEKEISKKDSSAMLQSGAKKVYFAMVNPKQLKYEMDNILQILPKGLIICESGGLHEFVVPGLFLMVKRKGEEIIKTHLLNYSPMMVNFDGKIFDFDIQKLKFEDHQIKLKM